MCPPLDSNWLSWTSLLAHWMDLARAARALDGQPKGPWQQVMPALITFEALARSLPHISDLPVEERALALDQAGALLSARRADVEDAFDEPPEMIAQADAAAADAIVQARRDLTWTIMWEGPGLMNMPEVRPVPASASDDGVVAMMPPGTLALPGTPVAWWQGRDEPMLAQGIAGCRAIPLLDGLQVWRSFDPAGRVAEDRVRSVSDEGPETAVPLLAPRLVDSQRLELPPLPETWPPSDQATMGHPLPPVRWDTTQG